MIGIISGLVFLTSCSKETKVIFLNAQSDPVIEYAQSELNHFLDQDIKTQAFENGIGQMEFSFQTNPDFEEAAFQVDSKLDRKVLRVILSGETTSDALYAAYTFLEEGGYLFEITGPLKPTSFDWEALKHYSEKIVPAVKKRGIRQHINFPMDVSAWSLDEAKSYIQNLSRMRFNYMTFHSYPGQWYEVEREDTTEYAGHFFYGDVHMIPEQKDIMAIAGNQKYFCIPEIEPFFEDKVKKSQMAVEWLQAVISESKRTGIKVQFSFEPRNSSTDIQKTIETAKAILKQYPMIDALELITEEAGGWGPRTTEDETRQMIVDHFGQELLQDSTVMKAVMPKQSDLAYIYGQIGHSRKVIQQLRADKMIKDDLSLKLGIYVAISDYAKPAYYLARKFLPDTEIALLSAHHSMRVDRNLPKILIDKNDWEKSIIYSWIELDGLMYIQQNAIRGIRNTIRQSLENSSDLRGNAILFNHWRTAENKITARYAAEASLNGPVDVHQFYQDYAHSYGIAPKNDFAKALQMLGEADLSSMNNLPGFGFCWTGRWRKGGPLSAFPVEKLQKVREAYKEVLNQLKICSDETSTPTGHSLLAFLDNRIRTTIIYIKAFEKARELKQFDTSKSLQNDDKQEYVRICNETLALFEQYIHLYAQINADRGCPGNLVSLWHGPVKGMKIYREKYGGIPFDEEVPPETAIDEPPLPTINPDEELK